LATFQFDPYLINECYWPLLKASNRYLVLYGGAGSGKSVFAAEKVIFRAIDETPHRFLVVRKVAKTIRNSIFAEIRDVITQWKLTSWFKVNKSDMEITCLNGNMFMFAGLDDVEKLKSIHKPTSVLVEEASEITRDDFIQLDLRLRGMTPHYKQIILCFNPVVITHWLKQDFFDHPRRDTLSLRTTYLDNRFIDNEYKQTIEDLRLTDPYYYQVYGLGEWGIVGKTVYNAEIVTRRLLEVRHVPPVAVGSLLFDYQQEQIIPKSIQFSPDPNGPLTIYQYPQPDTPYVIGGDIAEGGHDWSVASVRDNATLQQVALWRDQTDTDLFAKQMFALGVYYNKALVGIETNFDTHPTKELERLYYPNQYVREQPDRFTGQLEKKFGFKTTKVTRPLIIGKHVALARDRIDTFHNLTLVEEMLAFKRNEDGRPQAAEGEHDDCVMADAICYEVRMQQRRALPQPPAPPTPPGQAYKEKLAAQQRNRQRKGRVS